MASTKKKTTSKQSLRADALKKTELRVTAPKKTTRKKVSEEIELSEVSFGGDAPKSKIITRKYLYAVVIVLAVIGLLFTASRFWVIAWVDNKPVTKFELYSVLESRDAGKTKEELIVNALVKSEGSKQRQSVSDGEVEAEIKKIEENQGGAEQLDQILSIRGLTREDFLKLVSQQLLIQKLFGKDVNITEEDVDKYIATEKASLDPKILASPESSEAARMREGVKEQLKWDKVNENYNNWLKENLESSRISRN